jgi:hypothetical protein
VLAAVAGAGPFSGRPTRPGDAAASWRLSAALPACLPVTSRRYGVPSKVMADHGRPAMDETP